MYSGYTHSTAHKKAVAEVPAKRLIACCWSERMVQITSGSFFPQALRRAGNCIVLFLPVPLLLFNRCYRFYK